jgi:tRNA_anti-like
MKRKKRALYIVLALLVILAAVAWYIYKEYNRTHKDTAKMKADFSLTTDSLLKEFAADEKGSNAKYWDKVIRIEGLVKEVRKDEKGFYSIALGDTASLSSVRCSIDSAHGAAAALLKEGSPAAIKGICSGYNADEMLGADVILVRCVIDKKD